MLFADYHTHTLCSPDARNSMEEMAAAAIAAGLNEICFTEHMEPLEWNCTIPKTEDYDWSRLEQAFAAAKAVYLPKDKIEAAIRKGTGEDAGGDLTECFYEGYGPAGIAIMVEVATDNKNRTVAEVRHLFTKHGGSLGTDGSVSCMFDRKGVITVEKAAYTEDQMMEVAMEAGADDVIDDDDVWTLQTAMADFAAVRDAL